MKSKLNQKAIILRWRDGDTIDALVECPTCRIFHKRGIRLARIESYEPSGNTANQAEIAATVLNKRWSLCWCTVQPVKSSDDLHGRIVGEVWVDGKNLSDEIVRLGLGWYVDTRQKGEGVATFST